MMDPNSSAASALDQSQMLIPPSGTFPLSTAISSTSSSLPTSLPSTLSPMPTSSCSSSSSSSPMIAAEHQQELQLKDLLQMEDLQSQNDDQQQFEVLLQHTDQQQQQQFEVLLQPQDDQQQQQLQQQQLQVLLQEHNDQQPQQQFEVLLQHDDQQQQQQQFEGLLQHDDQQQQQQFEVLLQHNDQEQPQQQQFEGLLQHDDQQQPQQQFEVLLQHDDQQQQQFEVLLHDDQEQPQQQQFEVLLQDDQQQPQQQQFEVLLQQDDQQQPQQQQQQLEVLLQHNDQQQHQQLEGLLQHNNDQQQPQQQQFEVLLQHNDQQQPQQQQLEGLLKQHNDQQQSQQVEVLLQHNDQQHQQLECLLQHNNDQQPHQQLEGLLQHNDQQQQPHQQLEGLLQHNDQQQQQQHQQLEGLLQHSDQQQQQQFADLLQQYNHQQQQQLHTSTPTPQHSLQLEHLLQTDEQEQLLQRHREHMPEPHKAELEKLLESDDPPKQPEIQASDLEQLLQITPDPQASSSQATPQQQQHQPLLQQLLQQTDQVQPGLELQPQPQPQLEQLLNQPSPSTQTHSKPGDPDKHPQEQLKQLLLQPDTSQQHQHQHHHHPHQHQNQHHHHSHHHHHHSHHHHQQQQHPQQIKTQQAVVSLLPPSSSISTNLSMPMPPPAPSPEAVIASIMSSASKMILQHQAAGLLTPTAAQQYLEMMRTRAANYATAPSNVHQKLLDDLSEELGKLVNEGIEESVSKEVFSKYEHRELLPGCLPHPGDIVEAGSLSSLFLPAPWYPLTTVLTPDKLQDGQLSSLQLEGILYACQKHQTVLPNGHRAGFFIGDGAGVGKGRQVSGIILDNFSRGRVRHIWFSISTDLVVDARRDLKDIGCHIRVIDGCNELDKQTRVFGLSPDLKEGVVFSTYATLVSSVQRGSLTGTRQSRLQQLINWCGGKDFDGCLIFDECHKAKNFVPGKEHASTKVANAVMTIQRLLPKARVIYCSATGVSDVKNMAFMERLGLWGDGAPFPSFENFLDCMARKGLGAAEMLAMEMKTSGMYVSRGLSFKQAEFVTVEAELTCEQMRTYDTAAYVWNELRKALITALHRTNCGNNRIWTQYWSSHQRFFKQLCMGMKVPTIVRLAKEALNQEHCVVIGLQTTGEASLESEMGRNKGITTGFVSLCREILTRFIRVYFPTNIECGINEPPREDAWCKEAKSMLLKYALEIELPDSPLDAIIDQLGGPEKVAEMTGRRGRVVRHNVTGCPQYELRAESGSCANSELESLNVNERNRFMDGRKLIAIISDAASTGISLHADIRSDNQRRREHLTIELPWSADKAVQQLGRSHRSNQSSGPLYKLVTTNLGGERRFAAAVARRLQSLGALTKGDRRAATGADLTEFNFDTPYGRIALRTMYQYICISDLVPGVAFSAIKQTTDCLENFHKIMQDCLILMGIVDMDPIKYTVQVKKEDLGNVGKFLNRILGLPVMKQNLIFNYFIQCLDITIMNAKREGKYNEGLLDITASSVEMIGEPKEVFKDLTNGNTVTKLCVLKIDRGMTWDEALNLFEGHTAKNDGFYLSKGKPFGRKLCLLALTNENSKYLFKIARPNTGVSLIEMEKSDLQAKYTKISLTEAKKAWQEQHEATQDHCMHGRLCRSRGSCTVGSRCYRMHVLCGSIVTLMSVLEAVMARHSYNMRLSKAESSIRVVRIRLNSGERVVGIRYPEQLIVEAEKVLKEHQIVNRNQAPGNCQSPGERPMMTPFNSNPGKMIIEEVTPVVPKYLIKAFTPPVTMHTYFKSSRAGRSPHKIQKYALEMEKHQQQQHQHHQQQQQPHHHQQQHHHHYSQPSTQLASSSLLSSSPSSSTPCSLMQSQTQHSSSLSSSPSCSSSSSSSSSFVSCGNQDDVGMSCSNNSRVGSRNDRVKKRSANYDSYEVSLKKPRQSTITMMFKRQSVTNSTGNQQVLQCRQCPVCNVAFQPGMTNDHINSHIDNCLL